MVFMLAYLIGVLLFLELSSALSHYDVLGISRSSGAEIITESFSKLSGQLHPDNNLNDPDASGRYAALKLAYKILGDATSKENYDRMLQSSELGDNDTVSQQDRGKNLDRVIVGTYIPANDHADTNSQTYDPNAPEPPTLTEEEGKEKVYKLIGNIYTGQISEIMKNMDQNALRFLTHPTLFGRIGFLVGVLLVLCIAGLFVTVVSLSGIVYNHWDVIICCTLLWILFRMYRGRNRQIPRPLQEVEHKTN